MPYSRLYRDVGNESLGWRTVEFTRLFEGGSFVVVVQLAVLPIVAGAIASYFMWKARLGRASVHRILTQDKATGRPAWKIVVRALGRPLRSCRIRVGRNDLRWEGAESVVLDIGGEGIGMVRVPFQVEQDTLVTIKSGSATVFRGRFGLVEEAWIRK